MEEMTVEQAIRERDEARREIELAREALRKIMNAAWGLLTTADRFISVDQDPDTGSQSFRSSDDYELACACKNLAETLAAAPADPSAPAGVPREPMDAKAVRDLLSEKCASVGSQLEFARLAGVSPSFLNDVLRGRREPSGALLAILDLERIVTYGFRAPSNDARTNAAPAGPKEQSNG